MNALPAPRTGSSDGSQEQSDQSRPAACGLLVKVHATTVNRTDCADRAARPFFMRFLTGLIRHGRQSWALSLRAWSRRSAATSRRSKVGDKVFGYNEGRFGAHAEYMSVPENGSVATMPANVACTPRCPHDPANEVVIAEAESRSSAP
jgi:NADPH:quinone reductase-like Zn-dependent oxidoreductase